VSDEGSDRFARLAFAIAEVRAGTRVSPRSAKLLSAGLPKMAQKVVEEATEVALDAVLLRRTSVINESVDLFYNLIVLWDELGIEPTDVWAEMDRREEALGIAEKLPKQEGG
jgi:phosphoribosyl-ATP pyrophosphohydrolase